MRRSPQEEPQEYEDAARRHSAPWELHISWVLSVMTLAIASMTPAGSSASVYKIITLNTLQNVRSFQANGEAGPRGFPVNHRGSFVLRRTYKKIKNAV